MQTIAGSIDLEEIAVECVMLRKRIAELTVEYSDRTAILAAQAPGKTFTLDDGVKVQVTQATATRPSNKIVVTMNEEKLYALSADQLANLVALGIITMAPGVTKGQPAVVKVIMPKE